jgi:prefoldin subunit 5
MQKQIERTTECYKEFLRDVDSASNKLGSRNRDLTLKYRVLVGVAAVACLGLAASVGYLAVSLTAKTISTVAVSNGFAAFYGAIVLSFNAFDWVGKVGDASTNVQNALTALGNIKESGDGLVTELQAVTSSVESVERCIKQVEEKLLNLDDTVEGFDHDKQNLIHCGRKLVKECDQMQQQFSELGRQIELLREQVKKAQRSRWN